MKKFIKNIKPVAITRIVLCLLVALNLISPLEVGAESFDRNFAESNNITFYDPTDTTCAEAGTSVNQLTGQDNREKIWNFLTAKGLSSDQAAGVLGNIQSESAGTFSPTINEYPDSVAPNGFPGGGYGIVQWTNYEGKAGGRRDVLVADLTAQYPDLMAKYYNSDYSTKGASYTTQAQGFVSKSASTGTLMPVADNDNLLLGELNHLYDESNARTLGPDAVAKGLGSSTETEWDALKNQTTVAGASNVWVYSYEVPANIDATAEARVANGNAILQLYGSSASGASCSGASTDKVALAKEIIASGNISYYSDGGMNATQKIIEGIANGTNNGNDWPCGMNLLLLQMVAAVTKTYKVTINSSNRACTNDVPAGGSMDDRHYNGNGSAIDWGSINGISLPNTKGAALLFSIIGPMLINNSSVGQVQCGVQTSDIKAGVQINRFDDACNHIHTDVPPDADPSLKCKTPVFYGGCDASQQVK